MISKECGGNIGGTIRDGSEGERFTLGSLSFDIDSARAISRKRSNSKVKCSAEWSKHINVSASHALKGKSRNAVFIALLPTDQGLMPLLIDGHHRMFRAMQEGESEVDAFTFTPEEVFTFLDAPPDVMAKLETNLNERRNQGKPTGHGLVIDPNSVTKTDTSEIDLAKGDVIVGKFGGKKVKIAEPEHPEAEGTGSFGPHKVGSMVVHQSHGMGKLIGVEEREFSPGKKQTFGIMSIHDQGAPKKIFVSDPAKLRATMTPKEAEKVRAHLQSGKHSGIQGETWNRRYREAMEKLHTGDIHDAADVHNQLQELKTQKDLSFGESKMLDQAHQILHSQIKHATGKGIEGPGFKDED